MLLWLCFGRAAAQPGAKLRAVVVTSEDGPPLDEGLLSALRELFARVGLELVETDEGKDEGLLARVRIQRDVDAATVRVFSVAEKRLASTHRVPRGETEALSRETVAHVVLGAVEPLVEQRAELEAQLPPEPAPVAPPTSLAVETEEKAEPIKLHYLAGLGAGPLLLLQSDVWAARIFGRADVYLATRLRSVLGITLAGIVPVESREADTESKLALWSLRVQGGIEPWVSRHVRLGVLLSAGADLSVVHAQTSRSAQVHSPVRKVAPLLGGFVQARFPLVHGVELAALIGCDLDLKPYAFKIYDGDHPTTVFEGALAHPYAGLLVAWSSL